MKPRLLFLLYILFGITNGFIFNFFEKLKNLTNNHSEKIEDKSEKQPFCKNCGKFDNSWNDRISLKLRAAQFEKINKCEIIVSASAHNVEKLESNLLFYLTFVLEKKLSFYTGYEKLIYMFFIPMKFKLQINFSPKNYSCRKK